MAGKPSSKPRGNPPLYKRTGGTKAVDPRSGFADALARLQAKTGISLNDKQKTIPDGMTFRQWCEKLASEGLKVDGKPFRLDNRPALLALYDAIPSTKAEAKDAVLVVQKATQLGATIWEVLANIYLALKFEPMTIGMFMPTQAVAIHKSEHRFMRMVRSAPQLYELLTTGTDVDGSDKKVGEGNVLTRKIKESLLLFLWTTGKVTTESIPMDSVTLDEVQEMTADQIDKVRARTGDSDVGFTILLSTANVDGQDINAWYCRGTSEVWHTECQHCKKLSDLSDPAGIFPDKSISYNVDQIPGAPSREYIWTCPECGGWIKDPQIGRFIVTNPGANPRFRSFLLPRTVSPSLTPRKMFEEWSHARTGNQRKSFYNRTLARPYVDVDQLPVTMAHCEAAAAAGIQYGLKWEKSGKFTTAGIDQMGSFNCMIIKRRLPDGRQAVVHVEAIFDADPFARCSELMDQYGVEVACVEQLPNVNDARRFANRHPGRVFLAGYADLRDDQMVWGDDLSKSDRRTAEEDRTRYSVTLNQYKCMQTAMFRIRDGYCLFPDPSMLEQDVIESGVKKRIPILREWVFFHYTKIALIIDDSNETVSGKAKKRLEARKLRAKVVKIGSVDPHFAFANMLCDVAWARSYGTSTFILPEAGKTDQVQRTTAESMNMPGLPSKVVDMMESATKETCGACISMENGMCTYRNLIVGGRDPACEMYVSRS